MMTVQLLSGVQFDDQMFRNRRIDFFARRITQNFGSHVASVHFEPSRNRFAGQVFGDFLDQRRIFAAFGNNDGLIAAHKVRRDINAMTIHEEVAMTDQLSCLSAAVGKTKTEDDIVKSSFQQNQQVHTGNAFLTVSLVKVRAELTFQYAVNTTNLLFFTHLHAVFGYFFTSLTLAMLTRSIGTLSESEFITVAAVAFEVQFDALTTAQSANRSNISSHFS